MSLAIYVERPVMIVALAEFQLFVAIFDAHADRRGLQKIERSVVHVLQFAGRESVSHPRE